MTDIWKDLYKKSFGEKLKKARAAKSFSIRKVSSLTGISASYLSYIERGIHGPPSMEVIDKLVVALNADKDELIAAAGYVSREVSEAYQKNPKGISGAAKKSNSSTGFGIFLGFLLLALLLNSDKDESEELPEPKEAYEQLKKSYLDDDSSITKEREYFEYCTAVMKHWKDDLEKREKKTKK